MGKKKSRFYASSEQERYAIANERDLRKAKVLMDILRPIELTWLEAAVLLHYYFRNLTLEDTATAAGRHVREIEAARRSLLAKVAVALGYATEDEAGVKIERAKMLLL